MFCCFDWNANVNDCFLFGQSPFFFTEIRAGGMWNGRRTWKREWMTDMAKVSESSSFIDPVVCMKRGWLI